LLIFTISSLADDTHAQISMRITSDSTGDCTAEKQSDSVHHDNNWTPL